MGSDSAYPEPFYTKENKDLDSQRCLPCPMCGGVPDFTVQTDGMTRFHHQCPDGMIEINSGTWDSKEEAIDAWNKRYSVGDGVTLEDLAVKHDYYCSDHNFHKPSLFGSWRNFTEFYEQFKKLDIDQNLVFRWDVHRGTGFYWMEIFMVYQRKGIFVPHRIDHVSPEELPIVLGYLRKHHKKLMSLWEPISLEKEVE